MRLELNLLYLTHLYSELIKKNITLTTTWY